MCNYFRNSGGTLRVAFAKVNFIYIINNMRQTECGIVYFLYLCINVG